ncbi:hypothetical protein HU200_060901 [Digitaria exilis]|uniref:Epidermal patterning factor-like protein n=1 Tax=Digitaria exilis TaxID=1010633 RepID=A0A835ADH9_9POAL|nr:hypothetical protein HU200_060901 [Digitaria exilis]
MITSPFHETSHAQAAAVVTQQGGMGDGAGTSMRSMVGSRPPSCAGRCWWCGDRRCEAVQVPITPQEKNRGHATRGGLGGGGGGRRRAGASLSSLKQQQQQLSLVSSYNDHSNYKPLSWRCKCAGLIKP